jgi:hypothetical protein
METELEMSPIAICVYVPVIMRLIVLACFLWPFISVSFLARRATSAGPIPAALVPLALSVAGMFNGIHRTLEGMAMLGDTRVGAAVSAGLAEALAFPGIGAFFAVLVATVAAIRRHRAFVDRVTATIFVVLVAGTIGGICIAANLVREQLQFAACLTGAAIAAITAIVAAVWTFRTGRGRTTSRPIPYGVVAIVALSVILGLYLRQEVLHYAAIAIGR